MACRSILTKTILQFIHIWEGGNLYLSSWPKSSQQKFSIDFWGWERGLSEVIGTQAGNIDQRLKHQFQEWKSDPIRSCGSFLDKWPKSTVILETTSNFILMDYVNTLDPVWLNPDSSWSLGIVV